MEFISFLGRLRILNFHMSGKINLINGNFITLDDHCPSAEIISIENGKIAGINAPDHRCNNIDLNGATVIPGFVDALNMHEIP